MPNAKLIPKIIGQLAKLWKNPIRAPNLKVLDLENDYYPWSLEKMVIGTTTHNSHVSVQKMINSMLPWHLSRHVALAF
jgi:hypothetical protein